VLESGRKWLREADVQTGGVFPTVRKLFLGDRGGPFDLAEQWAKPHPPMGPAPYSAGSRICSVVDMTKETETMSDITNQSPLSLVRKLVGIYGVVSVLVLATVAVVVMAHGSVSEFMWIRAGILLAVAPLLYRFAVRAGNGETRSLERLRGVSLVLPIAIIGIDLIPGMCPVWYTALQAGSALALVAVAVLTRTGSLRRTRATAN
jgi:hypothetical protein